MWIVRLALRRPYTFVVSAFLILILGAFSILSMPTDIFPNIDIPVVSVIWNYTGLSPEQISQRIVTINERGLTTTVNDIEHIESQSLNGVAVIKIFFQPHVNISSAVAQVTAICQTQLKQMPAGVTPPFILQFNASSVPVLQLGVSGQGLNEQQLNDITTNTIRVQLATIEGAQSGNPFGGKPRQVQVDLDLHALQAHGLSPSDVVNAVAAQNVIAPAGTMKVDKFEYNIETNSAPLQIADLNNLPIKQVNGAMVYVRDVAHVRDGNAPQTNIVRVDGRRAILLSIMKTGQSSTLDIIAGIRAKLELIQGQLPPQLRINYLSDQSVFVRGSINGVIREAVIAACLTAIMILVFLGSWRSTIIIAVSIPLSILCSIIMLSILGQTINVMTLGGLALAVGILVDDATVAIENMNRFLESGHELEQSILDGSAQIAVPALVSTLSICIVFVPMFFLSGVPRYLFVPMAESVVFAMLASYLLSRTLVPTMAKYLLKEHSEQEAAQQATSRNPFFIFLRVFNAGFERLRQGYRALLILCIDHAGVFLSLFLLFAVLSVGLLTPWLGQDFFPSVDSGQFKLHLRAHTGTRIEETAALCDRIERTIRQTIPADELEGIVDNIGLPTSGLNIAYSNSSTVGSADADIQVQLNEHHHPTEQYLRQLRQTLAQQYPGVVFYTLPVDMVTQILNFGLSAPLDLEIVGPRSAENHALAEKMLPEVSNIAGIVDAHIQQPLNQPVLQVDVDRTRAAAVGMTQKDVAQGMLVALSGSFQTNPTFFVDPKNGVSYNIATQTPQAALNSINALASMPISGANTVSPTAGNANTAQTGAPGAPQAAQVLGNLSTITPRNEAGTVSHYDIQPLIDIYANVDGTDLGSATRALNKIIAAHQKDLPRGSHFTLRGQSQTMVSSYKGLLAGLVFSILLVYLLIVVNFQSWLDPFLIISALPAALAGIVWFLFLTHTRLSVPALTGAIMCMGVATSNSILVVSFARERLEELVGDARQAAIDSGFVRLRPVMMTALAMIIGMVPMALGMGDGGEQNAPLGRAVIGGLLLATVATLFFVPTFFSFIHGRIERRRKHARTAVAAATVDEFDPITE